MYSCGAGRDVSQRQTDGNFQDRGGKQGREIGKCHFVKEVRRSWGASCKICDITSGGPVAGKQFSFFHAEKIKWYRMGKIGFLYKEYRVQMVRFFPFSLSVDSMRFHMCTL